MASFTAVGVCALAAAVIANPYATNPDWYVNPAFQKELDGSIGTATDPTAKANLEVRPRIRRRRVVDSDREGIYRSVSATPVVSRAAARAAE